MKVSKKINHKRRQIMRKLTSNVGRTTTGQLNKDLNLNVKRVLINRPNSRLGNQLLITPLIQEVVFVFPDCKVDVFVRGGLAPILFRNYKNIGDIIRLPKKPFKELFKYMMVWIKLSCRKYDLVINVDGHSSSGRLSTGIVKSRLKLFSDIDNGLADKYPDYCHIAKAPVYNLRKFLSGFDIHIDDTPVPYLDLKLEEDELANGKRILDEMVSPEKRTICIYTFATGDKCYKKEWWTGFYSKLKEKYESEFNILEVLPAENVSQIDFAAPAYYSRDIREMASVMANTEVWIGADCGIMHLASAAPVPVVGLFTVTSIDKYEPYNKNSIAIDTKTLSQQDILSAIDNVLKSNKIDGAVKPHQELGNI